MAEQSNLEVVAHLLEESRTYKSRALTTTNPALAEKEAQSRKDGCAFSALVRLSDAQAALLAQAAEKDAEIAFLKLQLEAGPLYSTRLKAKRYAWLRESISNPVYCARSNEFGVSMIRGDALDAAIDSALLAEKEAK